MDFKLRDRDLSVVDADGKRLVVNGTVKAWIGGGQPATNGQAAHRIDGIDGMGTEFTITSEATLPN